MSTELLAQYRAECIAAFESVDLTAVSGVVDLLLKARSSGNIVFLAGNGGSAATASHMAVDLMLGSMLTDPPLKVIAFTDNQAIITATGNDVSFEVIFSRQLEKLGSAGDVLLTISASGNSPNVIAVVELAKRMGIRTIGFTGFDGGQLLHLVDLAVHVSTSKGAYGAVEDIHLAINHMITEQLKVADRTET